LRGGETNELTVEEEICCCCFSCSDERGEAVEGVGDEVLGGECDCFRGGEFKRTANRSVAGTAFHVGDALVVLAVVVVVTVAADDEEGDGT